MGKDIINFCLGLFQKEDIKEWTQSLKEMEVKMEEANCLLNKFSRTICKQVRKKLWNDRCTRLQDSGRKPKTYRRKDKKDNHTRNGRKKKISRGTRKEAEKVLMRTTTPGISQDINIEESIPDQVQNKLPIWEWIKEGKKWLGI